MRSSTSAQGRVCYVEGCERSDRIKLGLCGKHYQRLKRLGTTDLPPRPVRTCSIGGCGGDYYARDLCERHYERSREPRYSSRIPGLRSGYWADRPMNEWASLFGAVLGCYTCGDQLGPVRSIAQADQAIDAHQSRMHDNQGRRP